MNVLLVISHPIKTSFNYALLDVVKEGLGEAGHEYRVADLYGEDFQSAMIKADYAQFAGKPMPAEILVEQKRVEWAQGLVFIFPLFWWSLPGMLKGWIDRVISYGWAWEDPLDPTSGHLDRRKVLVLVTAGASEKALKKRNYDQAFEAQVTTGIWDYCNFDDVTTHFFYNVYSGRPESQFKEYLQLAKVLAKNF